jgi:hypothetical protein
LSRVATSNEKVPRPADNRTAVYLQFAALQSQRT